MTYHIFVSGRVQGVGYRRFAQKQAEALSLQGWTRNLLDGRVEVVASGPEENLEQYCETLKKGPAFSLVRDVTVKAIHQQDAEQPEYRIQPEGFEIRPDPEIK